jgi:hypothetical protein
MRTPALTSCILAAFCISAFAPQSRLLHAQVVPVAAPAIAKAPNDFAGESIVIVQADSVYTFAPDGTGTEERTIVARIQSDAAVRTFGVLSIGFAADSQHVEFLYARVRHPDGSVAETAPADAIELPEPVTREAPFYSDLKEKQLPIRSLRLGDTLEWKARITTKKSQAPGQFWGERALPTTPSRLARLWSSASPPLSI